MLEESQRDEQLEQVRVCAEIGMECTDFNPAKRPDTQHIINRLDEEIATAVPLGGTNPCNSIGEKGNNEKLNEILHSLNPDIRRCFEFCSIFPRGSKLRRDDLVRLWIAQEFVKQKTSCATEDMEDIAEGYIQELVSSSLLEPTETSSLTDCFTIHDVLHDILDKIAGDCFRIENAMGHTGEGWEGDVPRHTKHLLIQHYDGELITETIIGLEYLRTLIVYIVENDTQIEEEVIDNICKKLPKLRVLAVGFSQEQYLGEQYMKFSFPESVGQLKCLRYLAFRACYRFEITLPRTLNKLQHIQILDFGECHIQKATFSELVNLRHILCSRNVPVDLPYIDRLTSLQTLRDFHVSGEQGCELKQLRDLNKLRGKLCISGLEKVKSKEEALEANLGAKERLRELTLECSSRVEADVLEGLCPPAGLKKLTLWHFGRLRYPDWMMDKHGGGPKFLQELHLFRCSQPVPAFEPAGAFPHLHVLYLYSCDWDTLPGNMDHLTSLKELTIVSCKNIRSLPSLPKSIEYFYLAYCNDEFMKSCQTAGHPNWQKIKRIPIKEFRD